MQIKTYVEKVFTPECTAVHHVWSFDGESPEIGSLCECGQSCWDERHLTPRAVDGLCPNCGRDYFENETIVDGELRCSCARR